MRRERETATSVHQAPLPDEGLPDKLGARLIFDPVLGWRRRPGIAYEVLDTLHRKLVIGANGQRVVPGQPRVFRKRVWIFGCSITEGQWLEDDETYCTLLQKRFPEWRIEPFATGGYSTLQNLLQLEANLVTAKPDAVVFTYIPGHGLRNVADPTLWNRLPGKEARWNHGLGKTPYTFRPAVRLSRDGSLNYRRVYPPKNQDELKGMMANCSDPVHQDIVATRLFLHAKMLAKAAGATFMMAVLRGEAAIIDGRACNPDHLKHHPIAKRLEKAGVRVLDGDPLRPLDDITFRPIDEHPNAVANVHYAKVIGDALEETM
jgi:hypothetical protein